MKRIVLIAVPCLLFICSSLFAQVEFGVMAGINFNSPKINALNTGGNQLNDVGINSFGFHVGLYSTIDLELFAIQPEVYYSQQGGKYKVNNTQEHEVKMSFIQIPLLGRYNFLEYFHVLAGPQFGIPIQSEIAFAGGSPTDIKDQTKSLDVAAVIGIGLTVPDLGVNGSLRWSKGFSEMIDAENASGAGTVTSLKNSMIQISASYAFGGGK
ncbi:MAG: porin family protein [Reichenbachiella sp.]|uniref:porin family protein n=1 Tax=Reichenbachiella sp. TaxID=2184521 RepID=UPI003263BC94